MMVDDLLIMVHVFDEGSPAAPGHIRAFDTRTAKDDGYSILFLNRVEEDMKVGTIKGAYKFTVEHLPGAGLAMIKKEGILFAATGQLPMIFTVATKRKYSLCQFCSCP
jgi:hypothetical protein